MKIKTAVFLPDMHLKTTPTEMVACGWKPDVSKALWACLKFCADFKPDVTILGGDILDLKEISKHDERKRLTMEGLRLEHTFALANQILDKVDKFTRGEKVFLKGNHEMWLEMYVDEHPALYGSIGIEKNLKLKERGYKVIPENKAYKIGHARFIHGWYWNKFHSRKTVDEMGDNVFYGHVHDVQIHTKTNYDSQPLMGQSVGCLCDLDPTWRKGKPNRWVNGFGVFYFLPDGDFSPYHPIIINGRFVWNGKIYDGGK